MFHCKIICFYMLILNLTVKFSFGAPDKVVCYFESWSIYRPVQGNFIIGNIPPNICTHLIYAFISVNDDGSIRVTDLHGDLPDNFGQGGYSKLVGLKRLSSKLKVLVTLGGWNEGSVRYSQIFSNPTIRNRFALNAVAFLQKYGFDGLDIDWRYPTQRGGVPADRNNFSELLKTLRGEFKKHGYILTAAVAAQESIAASSYDASALGTYLDFMTVLAFNYHSAGEGRTGHNAPLFISNAERTNGQGSLNIDANILAWIRRGVSTHKIVLGVALYGQSYTLPSLACTIARCLSAGDGTPGPFTRQAGFLGYNEICQLERNARLFWDNEAKVPYLISGNQWVSYDNEQSAQEKVNYIKRYNLGGAMVRGIDTDDFRGNCMRGQFPVLSVLSRGILSNGEFTFDK